MKNFLIGLAFGFLLAHVLCEEARGETSCKTDMRGWQCKTKNGLSVGMWANTDRDPVRLNEDRVDDERAIDALTNLVEAQKLLIGILKLELLAERIKTGGLEWCCCD